MISIPLYLSQDHPCSYLDDRLAQSAFVSLAFEMTASTYSDLVKQGFRRSGDMVYAPHCPHCSACIPVRLKVSEFVPNRSQKRCWQKNRDIQVTIKPPAFEQMHYEMYLRYQTLRHEEGEMRYSSKEEYIQFLNSTWCNTIFVEFVIDNELAAIAVVDQLENALSAVYTFFEPKFSDRSLGVYSVLWQIDWARQGKKEFLYLGFWIEACKKMSYKRNYQPLQIFVDKKWQY